MVYVASVLGLFGVSATYHRITWHSAAARAWMRRLDHAMIFLLIAGTHTPIALLALTPPTRNMVLTTVWGGAAAGMSLKLAWPHAPRWVGVPLYVALGWVAAFVLPELVAHGGPTLVALLLAGGLLCTTGAVCCATHWPNPWPQTLATTRSSAPR